MRKEFTGGMLFFVLWPCLCGDGLLAGEELYNGIVLPNEWPPKHEQLPEKLPRAPWLVGPPDTIPIDVGRQLFVDDFLIEETNLVRRFHQAVYHPANPVLTYDKPWEMSESSGRLPTACPYSGGVWYDPQRKKFRMWYMGGYIEHLCLAESDDGITWTKPELDVREGSNIVLWRGATESNSLLMDLNEPDPNRRFKYFMTNIGKGWKTEYRTSADGIHWSDPQWLSGPHGDRTTVFYNPFRKRWVFALRTADRTPRRLGRGKRYFETPDINDGTNVQWPPSAPGKFDADAPFWVTADRGLDKPRAELGVEPQLYHLDCVAYESIMVGMFNILRGDFHENDSEGRDAFPGRPKCAEVCLGYSRDGFHWHRPTHETFAGISENRGDWNWGNVQSAGNSFLVVGDHLYFYVSGRRGAPDFAGSDSPQLNAAYAGCSTGLAILRRDGFASMNADDRNVGTLTTRKVRFSGSQLFVNAKVNDGELRAEILDENGRVLPGFSTADCIPVKNDKTRLHVRWKDSATLAAIAGRTVRFRFRLRNGSLYSFWVSDDERGASAGYVAGGGPGLTEHRDTVGRDADRRLSAASPEFLRVAAAPIPVEKGDAQLLPTDGLVLWLKADSLADLSVDSSVSEWKDLSGNGFHCNQPEAEQRPKFMKTARGDAALRFDGVDDHLLVDECPGLLFTFHQSSLFAVVRPNKGGGAIISQAHANLHFSGSNGAMLGYGSGFTTAPGKVVWPQVTGASRSQLSSGFQVATMIHAGDLPGQTSLWLNGRRVDDGKPIPYHRTSAVRPFIGCGYRQRSPWSGDIAEIILYCRALSDSEHKSVEEYLKARFLRAD